MFCAAPVAMATTLSSLPGATPGKSVTGIYAVSSAQVGGKVRVTRALVCAGAVHEMHTTNGGSGWLPRAPGSTAAKVSTSTFDNLLNKAGGLNKDVTAMSTTVKSAFLTACGAMASGGGSGGGTGGTGGVSPPSQVEPIGKTGCPQGYQFDFTTKKCHVLSMRAFDEQDLQFATKQGDWARRLFARVPLSSAQAFIKDIHKKLRVEWSFSNLGGGFLYSYTPVDGVPPGYPQDTVGVIQVDGGGLSVQWLVSGST